MSEPRHEAAAVMVLLDRAMAEAARGHAGRTDDTADLRDMAAVDIHVAFLQPGSGPLSATARVCGGGRSVCFCEAEAMDAQGHVVARGMGTFRALR